MAELSSETMSRNLYRWAELTDLCLQLKRAVLAASVPEDRLERELFSQIREFKERQWRTQIAEEMNNVTGRKG